MGTLSGSEGNVQGCPRGIRHLEGDPMSRLSTLRLAGATILGGVIGLAWCGPAMAAGPHITAHPDNLMVNTATNLVGTGFAPTTSLTVEECGHKNWIAPQNPCDSSNSVVVTTSEHGTFKTAFTVQTCPGGTNKGPGFSERCYIGVPHPSGVDTIDLLGAVRITVTGP
jgi:hypothetical protein